MSLPTREPRSADGCAATGAGLPRAVEIPLAVVGLILAAPVIGLGALAVALGSGSPVFFRQTRVGLGGRPFTLVKLRTMRPAPVPGAPQVTARDDARVTPAGRLLRRTKIDELPELWNVLRGDMALVGPRPEVPGYVDPSDPAWQEILRSRPGLTDPTTLSLRDEELLMASVDGDRDRYYRDVLQPAKLRGYREYLRTRSWGSDLRVLFRTGWALLVPGRRQTESGPISPRDLSDGGHRT
jgi:lipopolysaccharide/colanic/teichoic acid biosynthesis glycosyltransferase